jgi:general L-amino acid transport system permease protein
MIFLLDPPGEYEDDYFWNAEDLLGTGVKPAAWGGLVLNLIFATAALVVGFGIGIALAFGRRSNLPVFWMPSVGVIELIRSGPLVAWLFFAQILVPDLLNPVWEAGIASRVILVLSLFFGSYLAEVLRGGLQAVPHGQYEAATALGLSPIQTKLQIELPQAIRTTLPAIVSMMIGMLKDTSLVYFFGIYDAFRVAKDLPAQWDFIGQHEQALLFVGVIFWGLSFYLSKVSRRIEKNLGLTHEGGGDVT